MEPLASGLIRNKEGWHSRCVHHRCVQGRSSPESKCAWMWPGCSRHVGANCIKMSERPSKSVCKRGPESLLFFVVVTCRCLCPGRAWCISSIDLCHACCKCLWVIGWRRQTRRTDVYVRRGEEDVIWRKRCSEEPSSANRSLRKQV